MKTTLKKSNSDDYEFAFFVKKQAMGPHIAKKWGWDEDFQLNLHKQRWNEKPWFIIYGDGQAIGTVSIHELDDCVRFGEFYLLSEMQGRGIGTTILQEFLSSCDKKKKEVILEYLKWNPVGSLYKRNGFAVTSEDEKHYFLKRQSLPPGSAQ